MKIGLHISSYHYRKLFLVPFLTSCILLSVVFISAQDFGPVQKVNETFNSPSDVLPVDLDGDGDLDILAASALEDKIVWFQNVGFDQFEMQELLVGDLDNIKSAAVADLDGDGDMDILTATYDNDQIAWHENDGFANMISHNIISDSANGATDVLGTDIDGDGDIDVVSASALDNKIAWYENDGTGVFQETTIISISSSEVSAIAASDLNGDGFIDVASACPGEDTISWYENDGTGDFGFEQIVTFELIGVRTLFIADLNSDGTKDIVGATSNSGGHISRFSNNGDGVFFEYYMDSIYDVNFITGYLIPGQNNYVVVCAAGDGGFSTVWNMSEAIVHHSNNDPSVVVCVDDFNGDGDVEIVTGDVANNIVYYNGADEGDFENFQYLTNSTWGAYGIHAADMDGDFDMDVLSASYSDHKITWQENVNGIYAPRQLIYTYETFGPDKVLAADLDGDGDTDVISGSRLEGTIRWHENINFEFTSHFLDNVESEYTIHLDDYDDDDDTDILVTSNGEDEVRWCRNNGAGSISIHTVSDAALGVRNAYSCDIDGDGLKDVLSINWDVDKIVWYKSEGLTFGTEILISYLESPFAVLGADIDNDGDNDIVATSLQNQIVWYENTGDGTFSEAEVISDMLSNPRIIYSVDIDGDLDIDIVSGSESQERIVFFENLGNGGFSGEQFITLQANTMKSLFPSDLDADGDPDVLVALFDENIIGWYENLNGEGCTDEVACNYNEEFTIENGSCCYGVCGCMDSASINYNPEATCDDESCQYGIYGAVFYDENENGLKESSEMSLPFQQILLQPGNIIMTTDNNGQFYHVFFQGSYEIELLVGDAFPYTTTSNPMDFLIESGGADTQLIIGCSNEVADFEILVEVCSPSGYPCNSSSLHTIHFSNTGNVTINGTIEFSYDTLFNGYTEMTPIDSVIENSIYMSFSDLTPGESDYYSIELHTPTEEYLGEMLTYTAQVKGFFDGEEVALGVQTKHIPVTCAYDPNDKRQYPLGYAEPHFIAADSEPEFIIRFQNTGNDTATTVLIRDTLDVAFDLSTFVLIANTHNVFTTIYPETRIVEFLHNDIMLVDSTTNEIESHGLISYRIKLHEGLPPGTFINNTAYIYFDNNDNVITNTTWYTIHECTLEMSEIEGDLPDELNESFTLTNSQPYIESYIWMHNGIVIGEESELEYSLSECGNYEIYLMTGNPLCESTNMIEINFEPEPSIINQEGWILHQDDGVEWQWYFNGTPIDGATEQNYEVTATGYYSVNVTFETGCTSLSSEILVIYVGVDDLTHQSVSVFPNPMTDYCYVIFDRMDQVLNISLLDMKGNYIQSWNEPLSNPIVIERENLSSGLYMLMIETLTSLDSINICVH